MPDTLKNMTVADVMDHWPQTVPVFVRYHMACPGCAMAPFMTVREAAVEYGLPIDRLVRDLATHIPDTSASGRT